MNKSDNIINLVPVIIERRKSKHCQCKKPQYEVDATNREVRCTQCGNYIDPIDALMNLAEHWEFIQRWEKQQADAVRELENYKPWRKAIKRLEENIGRKGDSLPVCPHCHRGFHLEEVTGFVHQSICENEGWVKKKN